ncbi:cytochrome P450 [Immersiella caudata]|uniref:Cytochrome P450 n=1 Tax=Immersiella caudata TaxID=314043 RepID=A0AA39XDK5_9PEZI|nr:cytochrome P450 [Immersiella caudata]
MGLVEHLVEQASFGGALRLVGYLSVCFIAYVCLQILAQNFKLARRGPRASRVPSALPFGLSVVYRTIKSVREHTALESWRELVTPGNNYTAESRILARRLVLTANHENIKAILATQFNDYGKGKPFHEEWKPFLGDSIFTTDGDMWHGSRQLIRPQFIKDRVSDLHTFESHMQILFRAIANGGALNGEDQYVDTAAGDGKPVDISDLFFRFTLDSATDFLLGSDVQSLTTPVNEFSHAFNEAQRIQNFITRAGPLHRLFPRGAFNRHMKVINKFIDKYIDLALQLKPEELESKSKSDTGYTFLHALAGFTRDRKVLHDQLIAILLAGRDTTASTLSWTLYELGRHPEAVRRLREEILRVVGPDRAPTYDDLKSMKYLQNVMNETLRLYPSVPFNVRLALKDTTLPFGGGPDGSQPLHVLKDTPIGYSTLLMQRRADLYPPVSEAFPDVQVFSPDRWFHWQPKPWQYIPFNGGPRICIGQQFALTEMGYVLTRLFQRYERVESLMAPVDGGKPTLKAEIVLSPGDGVKVAFWEAKREKK